MNPLVTVNIWDKFCKWSSIWLDMKNSQGIIVLSQIYPCVLVYYSLFKFQLTIIVIQLLRFLSAPCSSTQQWLHQSASVMEMKWSPLLLLIQLLHTSSSSLITLAYLSCDIVSDITKKDRQPSVTGQLMQLLCSCFMYRGEMICYGNWWPTWYFKRLCCILLSNCFPQIYICLKGDCGCQQ